MRHLLSILTSELSSARKFVIFIWVFCLAFFIGIISLNLWIDPFFIFRRSPFEPRLASIDSHQRFTKSLQVITRQPHTIILGSSRVYRGFDVKDGIYNMGVCSLTLTEARSYIDHILRFSSPRTIVLGLDFWMCDTTTPTQVDWDKNIGSFAYVMQSFLKALLKPEAIIKYLIFSFKSIINKNEPIKKEEWTYEGFFRTEKRSKQEVEQMLHSYEKFLKNTHIDLGMLSLLEDIIHKCHSKGVKLYVYISPLHPETKAVYMKSEIGLSFNPWREKIQQICWKNQVPFHDFTDILKDSPLLSEGSIDDWLDYSHFSPKIGSTILQSFGILEGTSN